MLCFFRNWAGSWGARIGTAALTIAVAGAAWMGRQPAPAVAISAGTLPGVTTSSENGWRPALVQSGAALVRISSDKLESLGIETQPVRRNSLPRRLQVTGRLEIHGSRTARVHSLVEGVVREICVELGDTVEANQVLAYIDSHHVGEAKLALAKERLNLHGARQMCQWETVVHDNVLDLLAALERGMSPEEIETQFRDRPLGRYREQLVTALARVKLAAADHKRVHSLGQQGVLPEKRTLYALAEHDSAQAAYRALLEQMRFDAQQRLRVAQQRLQEAEGAVAIARSQLLILGYDGRAIDAMDPIAEGERVAYYPVRAPFAATVIARPPLLAQHVDEATTLVELADLSTLWLRADVFEKDLPSLVRLEDATLRFQTSSYPQQQFQAKILTVGHQVSDETRAVRLLAAADNAQGLLKPGMFVDVQLDADEDTSVLQIPLSAVQHHEGADFAFVACGDGQFARRDVRLGRSDAATVEVSAGLSEGDLVVVKGGFALKSEMLNDLLAE